MILKGNVEYVDKRFVHIKVKLRLCQEMKSERQCNMRQEEGVWLSMTVNFYLSFLLQKVKLKTREQFVIYKDVERDF